MGSILTNYYEVRPIYLFIHTVDHFFLNLVLEFLSIKRREEANGKKEVILGLERRKGPKRSVCPAHICGSLIILEKKLFRFSCFFTFQARQDFIYGDFARLFYIDLKSQKILILSISHDKDEKTIV